MENLEFTREELPKILHLYQERINCSKDPEEFEQEVEDLDTDEEVDVVTCCDSDQGKSAGAILAQDAAANHDRRSTSSCSSTTIHVCTFEGCDKFFSRPSRLAQHSRTHTGERPFVCPSKDCLRSYSRQQHLKRHIETAHQDKDTDKKVKCEICDEMLSNIYALRKHVNRIHIRRTYDCKECSKSFTKQQHLQSHTYVHTGIKPYVCDYPECEMRCLTPSVLKRHKLTHQKSRYACPQESCLQKFDLYKHLQHHISVDHPKVCDICSRPFKQLRYLKQHRLTHENQAEAFFCSYPACNKYYFQLRNLRAHIKEKHQELAIYECGACEKRLSTKQKLIQHMTTHSPSYKRRYVSQKPRKPRKDKGCTRLDFPRLLSGYHGDVEEDDAPQDMQTDTVQKDDTGAGTSVEEEEEEGSSDHVSESEEIS